jgi:hypothetical protein
LGDLSRFVHVESSSSGQFWAVLGSGVFWRYSVGSFGGFFWSFYRAISLAIPGERKPEDAASAFWAKRKA